MEPVTLAPGEMDPNLLMDEDTDIRVPFSGVGKPIPANDYYMYFTEYTIGKAKSIPVGKSEPNTVVNCTFAIDADAHPDYANRRQWRTFAITEKAYIYLLRFLRAMGVPGEMFDDEVGPDGKTRPKYTLKQQLDFVVGGRCLGAVIIEDQTKNLPDGSTEVEQVNRLDSIKSVHN